MINDTVPVHFQRACEGVGIVATLFEINHLCYLFIFLFYTIFLFRFSLKKKSQSFWKILHGFAFLLCLGLTLFFYFADFIGLNLYGLCGFTSLIKHNQKVNWNIVLPSFSIFFSLAFLGLGIFTSIYFKKHMPEEGQLKARKIKNSRIIFLFVAGFSILEFITSFLNLYIAIDCENEGKQSQFRILVTFVNILRVCEFMFTISLILWNDRFRRKFKILIKNFFMNKKSESLDSIISPEKTKSVEVQMQEIMFNSTLLHLKDRSNLIDLLFVSQIYTIVSGVYAFYLQYFYEKNCAENLLTSEIKPINFKQSITFQVDNQSMKHYEFQTRVLLKLKLLKCRFTLHSPKVFQKLLKQDKVERVHESFKIMDNLKKIWTTANDGQGGKSGEFFFFSSDRRFVLKTITPEQFQFYRTNLPQFYDYYMRNKNSLLAKIYGLFTIKGDEIQRTYRLILMKNITGCAPTQILRVYDLKGSKYDREVAIQGMEPNQLEKITLKDIDFMKYEGKVRIYNEKSIELSQNLRKDAFFLRQLSLIDYSLLIVKVKWEEEPEFPEFWGALQRIAHEDAPNTYYHIGIIDYLQLWDFQKKSESWWKKLLGKTDISAVDPQAYCIRFINFVDEITLGVASSPKEPRNQELTEKYEFEMESPRKESFMEKPINNQSMLASLTGQQQSYENPFSL